MSRDGQSVIESYIRFKASPDNDDKKDSHFAQWAGVSISDIKALKRKFPEWADKALKLRREAYAEHITQVDRALLTAAKRGDTKAADLVYRRFDNWSPNAKIETNNYYNFADLVKGIKKPKVVQKFRTIDAS